MCRYCLQVTKDESGVQKLGDWVKFVKIDSPDRPMLTYELTDLQQKTNYQLEVRTLNEEGWSDFNAEFQFYTREGTYLQMRLFNQSYVPVVCIWKLLQKNSVLLLLII